MNYIFVLFFHSLSLGNYLPLSLSLSLSFCSFIHSSPLFYPKLNRITQLLCFTDYFNSKIQIHSFIFIDFATSRCFLSFFAIKICTFLQHLFYIYLQLPKHENHTLSFSNLKPSFKGILFSKIARFRSSRKLLFFHHFPYNYSFFSYCD